jgi:hypothetical protein
VRREARHQQISGCRRRSGLAMFKARIIPIRACMRDFAYWPAARACLGAEGFRDRPRHAALKRGLSGSALISGPVVFRGCYKLHRRTEQLQFNHGHSLTCPRTATPVEARAHRINLFQYSALGSIACGYLRPVRRFIRQLRILADAQTADPRSQRLRSRRSERTPAFAR